MPERDVCVVWWADPSLVGAGVVGLLDATERARREQLRRDEDRARFTVAASLLRLVAGHATGMPPDRVIVDRSCDVCGQPHGRPTLPGTGLFASISHSAARVAVALTTVAAIGVDVERTDGASPLNLAEQILGEGEAASTGSAFFVYWTRKEAAVKATGDGLRVPLREVLVTGPGAAPRLRSYPGRLGLSMQLTDLTPGEGYAAALAVLGDNLPRIEERHARELGERGFH